MTETATATSRRSFAPRALVFVGALLLFACEPLVAKLILPAAGGGAHVWATTLMFFQGALVLGYLYCHWVAPRLGRWHFAVACLPLVVLPLSISVDFDPASPVASLIAPLLIHIGPPFVLLSTTAVLAQMWAADAESRDGANPYPLYAISNAGSLTALLAYPLLVAPLLSLRAQTWLWSAGYVGYLVLLWRCLPRRPRLPRPAHVRSARVPRLRLLGWLMLSAAPAALLLATTNVIEQDIGSAPMVWVVPLAIYLLSFVLVFRERPLYPPFVRRFWVEIAAAGLVLFGTSHGTLEWTAGLFQLGVLLAVTVVAHAALYQSRPPAHQLTTFYLVVAVGGWLGGAFVVLAAPYWFHSIAEYPIALAVVAATVAATRARALVAWLRTESRILLLASAAFLVFAALELRREPPPVPRFDGLAAEQATGTLHRQRTPYGLYRVEWDGERVNRFLYHGTTMHGHQVVAPGVRLDPLSYYARDTPLGDVLPLAPRPRTAAAIGLGAGTMAAYFEAGERITFFELDPHVVEIARTYFTYLEDCPAQVDVVTGDGRVQLARSPIADGSLSVVIIDAFSSDSIPTHLLTREAIELYLRKLAPNGYLVFHISNRFHDLRPVLRAASDAVGAYGAFETRLASSSVETVYFAIARDPELLAPLLERGWTRADAPGALPVWQPWTDDYVNLLRPIFANL